jgi:hypothetical protein
MSSGGDSGGFIKSVIKALSGPRRTPDESVRGSPASDQSGMSSSENSDELENLRSVFEKSLEKRGHDDETSPLPIGRPENEKQVNALDDVSVLQDALD